MAALSRRRVVLTGATTLAAVGLGALGALFSAAPAEAQSTAAATAAQRGTRAHRSTSGAAVGRGFLGADLQTIATTLKLTPAQLRAQLQAGKSIAQVAQAQNVPLQTVKDAIVAAAKSRLDQAVAANRITGARETQELAALPARLDQFFSATPSQFRRAGTRPAANRTAWHARHRA